MSIRFIQKSPVAFIIFFLAIISLMTVSAREAQSAAFARNKDVALRLTQVIKDGDGLEVTYELRNISENEIWVYVGNNRRDGQPCERRIAKSAKKLYLGFAAVGSPQGSSPGEAVSYRYKKLLPGRAIMFRLGLDAVVVDFHPVTGNGQARMKAEDIGEIELKVGYYIKALDVEESCCVPVAGRQEVLVNSGWALSNAEDSIFVSVSRKNRWK